MKIIITPILTFPVNNILIDSIFNECMVLQNVSFTEEINYAE